MSDPVVAAFRSAAERYVAAVDSAGERDTDDLLAELLRSLAAVVHYAAELPQPGSLSESDVELAEVADWTRIEDRLRAALPIDTYWHVEPIEEARPEVGIYKLIHALRSVYFFLADGLAALDAGVPIDDVVFEWRLMFTSVAGTNAVDGLRILHYLVATPDGPHGGALL